MIKLRQLGFTLLELLIVLVIISIGVALVSVAFPTTEDNKLDEEAERLVAILESARSVARSSSIAVIWQTTEKGFTFDGLANASLPGANNKEVPWFNTGIKHAEKASLTLGPEPIIGKQALTLTLGNASRTISTDGLRPFAVKEESNQ